MEIEQMMMLNSNCHEAKAKMDVALFEKIDIFDPYCSTHYKSKYVIWHIINGISVSLKWI